MMKECDWCGAPDPEELNSLGNHALCPGCYGYIGELSYDGGIPEHVVVCPDCNYRYASGCCDYADEVRSRHGCGDVRVVKI
ncbi:MAG: hypothetical protein ABEK59_13560 [Halobacteria archaeon]